VLKENYPCTLLAHNQNPRADFERTEELIARGGFIKLLGFPNEILQIILELVLIRPDRLTSHSSFGALRTCKIMYSLGRAIFYRQNHFILKPCDLNGTSFLTPPRHGPWASPIELLQHLSLSITRRTDISQLIKLVEQCVILRSLNITISSVPENFFTIYSSARFHVQPDLIFSVVAARELWSDEEENVHRAVRLLSMRLGRRHSMLGATVLDQNA
jgi:hypothetical protein